MDHIFPRFAAEIATGFSAHFAFTACCGTEAQILLSPTIKLQNKNILNTVQTEILTVKEKASIIKSTTFQSQSDSRVSIVCPSARPYVRDTSLKSQNQAF